LESKWRLNVPLYGMAGTQFDLIARVRSGYGAGLWLTDFRTAGHHHMLFLVPGTEDLIAGPILAPITTSQRFPYGFDVDPD